MRGDLADAGSQCGEDRIEVFHHAIFAADHHAVAALQPPDAAAGADVDIVDFLRRQFFGAPDVVDVVGVAAVDDDVVRFEVGQQIGDGLVRDRRRNHQPDHPRLCQFLDEVRERGGTDGFLLDQPLHCFRRHVENHALVASFNQPPNHVCAHSAETDHSDLHN